MVNINKENRFKVYRNGDYIVNERKIIFKYQSVEEVDDVINQINRAIEHSEYQKREIDEQLQNMKAEKEELENFRKSISK